MRARFYGGEGGGEVMLCGRRSNALKEGQLN